jgi:hypothetical protein
MGDMLYNTEGATEKVYKFNSTVLLHFWQAPIYNNFLQLKDIAVQGDQEIWKKMHPIYQKVAQTVSNPKRAKIFTTKLNLKGQNVYIKPLLKS